MARRSNRTQKARGPRASRRRPQGKRVKASRRRLGGVSAASRRRLGGSEGDGNTFPIDTVLFGDFNALTPLNKLTTQTAIQHWMKLNRLKFPPDSPLPTNAVQECYDNRMKHLNPLQYVDSKFMKCVCHAFSDQNADSKYHKFAAPYYPKMTGVDHMPLIVVMVKKTVSKLEPFPQPVAPLKVVKDPTFLNAGKPMRPAAYDAPYQEYIESPEIQAYNKEVLTHLEAIRKAAAGSSTGTVRVCVFFNICEDAFNMAKADQTSHNERELTAMLTMINPDHVFLAECFVPPVMEGNESNGVCEWMNLDSIADERCFQKWAGSDMDCTINPGKAIYEVKLKIESMYQNMLKGKIEKDALQSFLNTLDFRTEQYWIGKILKNVGFKYGLMAKAPNCPWGANEGLCVYTKETDGIKCENIVLESRWDNAVWPGPRTWCKPCDESMKNRLFPGLFAEGRNAIRLIIADELQIVSTQLEVGSGRYEYNEEPPQNVDCEMRQKQMKDLLSKIKTASRGVAN